jgi:hypothetical protein
MEFDIFLWLLIKQNKPDFYLYLKYASRFQTRRWGDCQCVFWEIKSENSVVPLRRETEGSLKFGICYFFVATKKTNPIFTCILNIPSASKRDGGEDGGDCQRVFWEVKKWKFRSYSPKGNCARCGIFEI